MLDRRPESERGSDPFEHPRLAIAAVSFEGRRVQKAEHANHFLEPRAREVDEFPGPVGAIATTGRRAERLAVEEAEEPRYLRNDQVAIKRRGALTFERQCHNCAPGCALV